MSTTATDISYPPLPSSIRERRLLDEEMLVRLLGKPSSLAEMFDGARPRWAVDAIDRLEVGGYVCEVASGAIEVTTTGRAYLKKLKAEPVPTPKNPTATRATRPAA